MRVLLIHISLGVATIRIIPSVGRSTRYVGRSKRYVGRSTRYVGQITRYVGRSTPYVNNHFHNIHLHTDSQIWFRPFIVIKYLSFSFTKLVSTIFISLEIGFNDCGTCDVNFCEFTLNTKE